MKKVNKYVVLLILTFIRKILELNLSFNNIYFFIEFFIIAILGVFIINDIKNQNFKVKKIDMILMLVMLLGEILGFLYSYIFNQMFNKFIYRIFEFLECYYLLYASIPKEEFEQKNFDKIMKCIIVLSLISAIYAMIFQFSGKLFSVSDTNNFRMDNIYQSFLGHRNQFAIVLVCGCLACFYFIIKKRERKIMTILMILLAVNLIFTYSRASYLLLGVFAICYFILELGRKDLRTKIKFLSAVLFIIGIFIYIYTCYPNIKNFIDDYMIRQNAGMTGRDTLWNKALEYIDIPTILFGRSFGISRILLENDIVSNGVGFHNMYITHIITGGVILLIFYCIILSNIQKTIRKNIKSKEIINYFTACLIAFLCYGFFEVTDFFKIGIQQIFQTYFCITLPLLYLKCEEKRNEK